MLRITIIALALACALPAHAQHAYPGDDWDIDVQGNVTPSFGDTGHKLAHTTTIKGEVLAPSTRHYIHLFNKTYGPRRLLRDLRQ